jgi:hypothetical protein
MILHGHQYARPFVPTSMPYTTLCGSYVCKILQIMVGAMCTLLIFACLPTMSISVPLVDLAEAPTTNKERQALETLQCQYRGAIGKLIWDRSTNSTHDYMPSSTVPSLSSTLSSMALYLGSPGCSAKSMILLLPSVCMRIYHANLDAVHCSPCWDRMARHPHMITCRPCHSAVSFTRHPHMITCCPCRPALTFLVANSPFH